MTGEMTIENVINRSCINLHMKGRDKKEVIEEMAEMFDRAGVLVDKAGYIKAVYERESEGPTGCDPSWKDSCCRQDCYGSRKTG
jgi:PTS system fructose-specific IIA component